MIRSIGYLCSVFLFLLSSFNVSVADSSRGTDIREARIENEFCRIEFDPDSGALHEIANRLTSDEYLKSDAPDALPFRIYADMTKEFEIGTNEKFQLVFDDPAKICRTVVQPDNCRLMDVRRKDDLTLRYQSQGLEIHLRIVLAKDSGASDWFLKIANIGKSARNFLASSLFRVGRG